MTHPYTTIESFDELLTLMRDATVNDAFLGYQSESTGAYYSVENNPDPQHPDISELGTSDDAPYYAFELERNIHDMKDELVNAFPIRQVVPEDEPEAWWNQ